MAKLQHDLVLGQTEAGMLRKLILQVCHHIWVWLGLPKDIRIAFFYTWTSDCSLGLQQQCCGADLA